MKRIALLFIAAMLISTPAFAAGKTITESATHTPMQGKAQQTNLINETNVQNSTLMNTGKENLMDVGGISNSGAGDQTNVTNETTVRNSTLMNDGVKNEMRVGTVRQ